MSALAWNQAMFLMGERRWKKESCYVACYSWVVVKIIRGAKVDVGSSTMGCVLSAHVEHPDRRPRGQHDNGTRRPLADRCAG